MTDIYLACIVVLLALNLLVNVAMWARKSALWNLFTFSIRARVRRWRR